MQHLIRAISKPQSSEQWQVVEWGWWLVQRRAVRVGGSRRSAAGQGTVLWAAAASGAAALQRRGRVGERAGSASAGLCRPQAASASSTLQPPRSDPPWDRVIGLALSTCSDRRSLSSLATTSFAYSSLAGAHAPHARALGSTPALAAARSSYRPAAKAPVRIAEHLPSIPARPLGRLHSHRAYR